MDDLSMALAASGGISETEYFVIDNELRSISIPSNMRIAGVENDDDINCIPFRMPRYVKDTDLSDFQIRINYTNALGEGDLYMVQDKVVDDDTISFSWLLDRHAFASKGEISFVVCARLVVENSLVDKEFNTTVHKLTVLQGLETDKAVPVDVQDHFLDWLQEEADIQVARIQSVGSQIQEDIEDLIESIPSDYSELQNDKAPVITDTASGAVASFTDGADELPVKDLTVAIELIQDLHGYDNPWPAGGGKNKLPLMLSSIKEINTSGEWSGNIYTLSGVRYTCNIDNGGNIQSITVNGTASAYSLLRLCNSITFTDEMRMLGCPASSYSGFKLQAESSQNYQDIGNGVTIPADLALTRIIIVVPSGVSVSNQVFYPRIVDNALTDKSFSPYSNICPISGWTGANVTRTGKNLLPPQNITGSMSNVTVSSNGDIVTLNGTANAYGQAISNNSFVLPAGTYFLKPFDVSGDIQGTREYQLRSLDGTIIYCKTSIGRAFTLTEPTELCGRVIYTNGTVLNNLKIRAMITQGAEDPSAFEPYQGETYSVTFPSEAGTVYGGTLDVTTGTLTVDKRSVTLDGSETWTKRNDGQYYVRGASNDALVITAATQASVIGVSSDKYVGVTWAQFQTATNCVSLFYGQSWIIIQDSRYEDVESLISDLASNPLQAVYTLATPVVYDLTPTEVTTLLGTNNVWADTGDSTVEYRADTKLYIDKKIAALAAAMN